MPVYTINNIKYMQVEIATQRTNADGTHVFLVPEYATIAYILELQNFLWNSYTVKATIEKMKELGYTVHYMCTLYDDMTSYEI